MKCCSYAASYLIRSTPFVGMRNARRLIGSSSALTRVEKIAARAAGERSVRSGQFISVRPDRCMTHDNSAAVLDKYESLFEDARAPRHPEQLVLALDHNVQDQSAVNLAKYARIAAFAKQYSLTAYPAGAGIGHQLMCENGHVFPHSFCVASDSHSNMYGGLGALGTPLVRTDAAAIWATGSTWWQVPPVARVTLTGSLQLPATGKDVILALCGVYNTNEVLNHVIEFDGPGAVSLSVDDRLTVANMTTEWGALGAVFPPDDQTRDWFLAKGLQAQADAVWPDAVAADPDAQYAVELALDLSDVVPFVAGPNQVNLHRSLADVAPNELPIQKAYIVSCVNSRASDLRAAADVLRGSSVAPGVELYVAAASAHVEQEASDAGDWQALLAAGARPLPPGCGPCIGLGAGLMEEGERGISATNRNFRGRMGHPLSEVYLASPAVVAHSARAGFITGPPTSAAPPPHALQKHVVVAAPTARDSAAASSDLVEGFPPVVSGRLLLCARDDINTDGIYPGKYTYDESYVGAKQAGVAMENYDEAFRSIARRGDLLVVGRNFGAGSSREQAATALKHFGIRGLIAASLSETYKRNAINNGLLVLESPQLYDYLLARRRTTASADNSPPPLTEVFPDQELHLDMASGELQLHRLAHASPDDQRSSAIEASFTFPPLGPVAQSILSLGGLEAWIKRNSE